MLVNDDNLMVMRKMKSGIIDLVYTDPPFMSERDYGEFDDRWSSETHKPINEPRTMIKYFQAVKEIHSDSMYNYLCFMYPRLMEIHRLLKPTGSMYLHCDPSASHYLKTLLDGLFGAQNFRNEVVWAYTGAANVKKHFPRKHDIILFYAKSDAFQFNRDAVRIPYAKGLSVGGGTSWAGEKKNVDDYVNRGKVVEDWWIDVTTVSRKHPEKTGYPTQKPIKLLERIIAASTNVGDVVLDPFCGCATACVAAERLGRKWIGIDINKKAIDIGYERLHNV